jgi:hypothetical protein
VLFKSSDSTLNLLMSEVIWPSPYSWHLGIRMGILPPANRYQYYEKAGKPPSISCGSFKVFVSTSTNLLFYILTLGLPCFARHNACLVADLVFNELSRGEIEAIAMETESCPGFQKARADWEALNKSQHDLFARETDPLFIHTLGRRWAAFCKCRTQECTWMIMWSALAIK